MSAFVTINGKWLRRLRTERGITQFQLAHQAKLSKNTIRRADYGKPITIKTAEKIAAALGIDVVELDVMAEDDAKHENDNSMNGVSPFLRLCGARLKQARKNREMSIEFLARKSGYSETTIKRVEAGKQVSLHVAKNLSEILEFDMMGLVLNEGESFDDMSFRITAAQNSAYRAIVRALSPSDMKNPISNTTGLEMIVVLTRMMAQLGDEIAQGLGHRSAGPVLVDICSALAKQIMLERTEKGGDVSFDVISHCIDLLVSIMEDIGHFSERSPNPSA